MAGGLLRAGQYSTGAGPAKSVPDHPCSWIPKARHLRSIASRAAHHGVQRTHEFKHLSLTGHFEFDLLSKAREKLVDRLALPEDRFVCLKHDAAHVNKER